MWWSKWSKSSRGDASKLWVHGRRATGVPTWMGYLWQIARVPNRLIVLLFPQWLEAEDKWLIQCTDSSQLDFVSSFSKRGEPSLTCSFSPNSASCHRSEDANLTHRREWLFHQTSCVLKDVQTDLSIIIEGETLSGVAQFQACTKPNTDAKLIILNYLSTRKRIDACA